MRSIFRFTLLFYFIGSSVLYSFHQDDDGISNVLEEADHASEKGELQTAARKYREALSILEKQNDQQPIANTLYKLANILFKLGNYADVHPILERALKLHQQLEDKTGIGFDLTSMAQLNFMEGNLEKTVSLMQEALRIHEEVQNKKGIADTLLIGGIAYFRMGEFEKTSDYCTRSLVLSKQIQNDSGIQESLNMLGVINWQKGEFDKALEFFQEAIPVAEKLTDPSGLSTVYSNMGLIYADKGDFNRALDLLNKSLEIERRRGAHQDIANCLYNISTIQGDQSNYEKARASAQEALSIAEEVGDKALASSCLDALGDLYVFLGNYDAGLEYLQRSARISKMIEDKSGLAYTLKKIGTLFLKQAQYGKSIQYFRQALKLFEGVGIKRGIALTLNSLGNVNFRLGNYNQALKDFQTALSIAQDMKIKPVESESYIGIGSVHYAKSELSDAEEAFSKSVEISTEIGYVNTLWRALHKKSLVYRDNGRMDDSLKLMKESVDAIEKIRGKLQLAEEKTGYFEEKLNVYEDLVQELVTTQKLEEAFDFAQRAKARSFLDMLAEARIDSDANVDLHLRQKKNALLAELGNAQKRIESEYEKEKSDQNEIKILSKKRNELELEYSNLTLEIRKGNPRYANLEYPQPMSFQQAQQMLDDQTILLEYFIGETHSFLFSITNKDVYSYNLSGNRKLTEQVLRIRESLQNPKDNRYRNISPLLYSELVKPAENQLNGKTRVLVAPDGPLNYLPFETLIGHDVMHSSQIPFLALQFEIYYVPSISILDVLRQKKTLTTQKQLIAFANPLITEASVKESPAFTRGWAKILGPLPNAKREVEEISKLYTPDDVSILLGKSASEQNVKTMKLDQYRKIHFASHGLIDEEKPEFSALLLSSDAKNDEDGLLTMREVFGLKLNADLVVLSACKTGLGQNIRGEGVSGLSRAFLVAGTSAVLVSLWDVYDRTTANFMKSFYQNMEQKKMSKTEALKQVRTEMIQSGNSSHPYYWAPFVLIGEN